MAIRITGGTISRVVKSAATNGTARTTIRDISAVAEAAQSNKRVETLLNPPHTVGDGSFQLALFVPLRRTSHRIRQAATPGSACRGPGDFVSRRSLAATLRRAGVQPRN